MAEVPEATESRERDNHTRRRRKFKKNRQKKPESAKSSFRGPLPGYETTVYDISRNRGSDAFSATTRKLAEYIARTTANAGEFMNAMNPDDLGFENIDEPTDPNSGASAIELEKWKTKYRNWDHLTSKRKEAIKAAYAIVIGQVSDTVKDKMKTYKEWNTVQSDLDLIELLKLIRRAMYSGTSSKSTTLTYLEAESNLVTYRQGNTLSNSKYLEIFRNKAEIFEMCGGEPGACHDRIKEKLIANKLDPDNATAEQLQAAKNNAQEEYLSVLFIKNCDPSRYAKNVGSLKIRHVENDSDPYPSTLTKALEMLETWEEVRNDNPPPPVSHEEAGIAFNTIGEDNHDRHGRDRGGRGGRGRGRDGRGRGNWNIRGGRREYNPRSDHPADNHNIQHEEQNELGDNDGDMFDDYYGNNDSNNNVIDYTNQCHNITRAQKLNSDKSNTLIIDSASTIDVIGDKTILHDIHDAPSPLKVKTIKGHTSITKQSYMGDYPHAVWYHPAGGVNILSLNNVQKYYRCTMDTKEDNSIIIHLNNGQILPFRASGNGLYQYTATDDQSLDSIWTFMIDASEDEESFPVNPKKCFNIDTVIARADKYTKRQLKHARIARNMENIVMRPGTRRFIDVCLPHFNDCPVTADDVRAAADVYGHNLGALKGKTTYRSTPHVDTNIAPVPDEIMKIHKQICLAIDVMFVNKIPFLVTTSRKIHFGTVEALPDRKINTVANKLKSVLNLYKHRGFNISSILADGEFEKLRPWFPQINTCAENEHVPDVERYIRTIKDSTRSTYNMLPFTRITRIMLIQLVKNAVFWLNSFPSKDGVSSQHSPRRIMVGYEVSYTKHVRLPYGAYVQTHENHSNDMSQRTMGAICLGPTGNRQGGHWFLSLTSGSRVRRNHWTDMPMPQDVIARVNAIGLRQKMPSKITYANRYGNEIEDTLEQISHDYDSDDDSTYASTNDDNSSDSSYDSDDYDSDDDMHDGDPSLDQELDIGEPNVVNDPTVNTSPQSRNIVSIPTVNRRTPQDNNESSTSAGMDTSGIDRIETTGVDVGVKTEEGAEVKVDDSTSDSNIDTTEKDDILPVRTTGVDNTEDEIPVRTTGVDNTEDENVQTNRPTTSPTESELIKIAELEGQARAANPHDQRPKRKNRGNQRNSVYNTYTYLLDTSIDNHEQNFTNLLDVISDGDPTEIFKTLKSGSLDSAMSLLTAQMPAKKGLKTFGAGGASAIKKELEQLLYRKVMHGKKSVELTREQKRAALRYLMFLKQKRCGRIKGRGCADGRKQKVYKTKEETSSPTIHIESLFLSCIIDAIEKRNVVTLDIPGAFMQADIDELIHVKLVGELADLLIKVDQSYSEFVTYENGKKVIYTELDKALYGTMQAALLFWKKLSGFLEKNGFVHNPYDTCVMNRMINGKQMTIGWHVDDLKISHVDMSAIEHVITNLESEFGREAPLTITRGKVHEYLGMKIDFSEPGKVIFSMLDYIHQLLDEAPDELFKGASTSPASNYLFNVNDNCAKLDPSTAILFHHIVAQLLYLSKRTRPDLLLAVSFLCTRVQSPDEDDWKKLGRCLRFLKDTKEDKLTLEADGTNILSWWIDASFAVHPNMRSHTGATMSMGKGCPISVSTKQKINTRSSTEAEIVGVNDALYMVLWVRHFLEKQGYNVKDNIIYQDNQSAMKLEHNGKRSSTKNTRHMEIRYFFITDNIKRNKLSVKYCPTDIMLGDYFTKPQQGSRMRKSRVTILNLKQDPSLISQECVGASTRKLDTNTGKYENTENSAYSSTRINKAVHKDCMLCRGKNDVLRSKAGSYLMAAKGLLKKVSSLESSLSLVNLK